MKIWLVENGHDRFVVRAESSNTAREIVADYATKYDYDALAVWLSDTATVTEVTTEGESEIILSKYRKAG